MSFFSHIFRLQLMFFPFFSDAIMREKEKYSREPLNGTFPTLSSTPQMPTSSHFSYVETHEKDKKSYTKHTLTTYVILVILVSSEGQRKG